ncbi:protoporphyrinogen oxidase HemJ [Novispirillum itersonii]|uniref:Protoporphyrinogen IX oxidase n=1 Tax=Novispirillum itersonii TaxID=189 RepID=A0A7W9ZE61_NOVIT|nr:protoporphyrinogen oxidase HemJ [Novispirillum itersonii]MBB6209755.1 putative membrane protein [Novispirillum itersonii]
MPTLVDPGTTAYALVKALHIISVITWMAAMFYLPRLFVYHASATPGSELSETFKVMERRLHRAIMTPSMIVVFITGLTMAPAWLTGQGWLHAKLVLVIAMAACHGFYARWRRQFAGDANVRDHRFYRIANEIPTVLLLGIVLLVVLKPF